MTGKYDLVVFDWDGTLVDSKKKIVDCLCAAAEEMELELSRERASEIIGLALSVAIGQLFPKMDAEGIGAFIEAYKRHFFAYPTMSELFDGTQSTLEWLAGFPELFVAVATGKSRAGLDRELDLFDLRSFFHITRCADETRSKPHPQMLMEILDYTAVEPGRALMVGDTDFDIEMAHSAGMDSVALTCGAHLEERLKNAQPRAMLDSVASLREWLEQ